MANTATLEAEVNTAASAIALTNELCDTCGGSVRAAHVAYKGDFRLYFCAHHARESAQNLTDQGFFIEPADLSF